MGISTPCNLTEKIQKVATNLTFVSCTMKLLQMITHCSRVMSLISYLYNCCEMSHLSESSTEILTLCSLLFLSSFPLYLISVIWLFGISIQDLGTYPKGDIHQFEHILTRYGHIPSLHGHISSRFGHILQDIDIPSGYWHTSFRHIHQTWTYPFITWTYLLQIWKYPSGHGYIL